ncbi:MAG TPA: hypothetical protein VIP75_00515 [Acidothermales bacterium]
MTLRVVAGDGPDLIDATRRLARGYAQTWAGPDGQLGDHDAQMFGAAVRAVRPAGWGFLAGALGR